MTRLLHPWAVRTVPKATAMALLWLLATAAAHPPAAWALSCMAPPPMDEAVVRAEIAFVGTVTAVANDAHLASISVEEVWAGPDLPAVVEVGNVRPADDPESVWDRTYTPGARYLFFPYVEDGRLVDGPCTFTSEWQPDFAKFRPESARTAAPAEPNPADPAAVAGGLVGPAIAVGILGVAIIGGAWFVSRGRST
ncbi:MAG: hypothetical protein AABZ33_00205 [Chloroflexota bacterium]